MSDRTSIAWFQSSGSRPLGVIAILVGLGVTVAGVVGGPTWPAVTGGLLLIALSYASIWRPALGLDDESLRLRGMYSTTVLPLVAIESAVFGRTAVVTAEGRRHVSSAMSRRRETASVFGRGRGAVMQAPKPAAPDHVDVVEQGLAQRRERAVWLRERDQERGVAAAVPPVVRRVAWAEVAVSVVLAVAFVVSFF